MQKKIIFINNYNIKIKNYKYFIQKFVIFF